MLQITLKPLDDGQKAVEIPLGKTTIGRGSFLGCSDKKVSRNHAVLEVTNKGEVFLTPTHVNPCFYQPTADSPGQILKKDVPHKLENGDSFSLLPRAYRYQLIVESETSQNETTDQNDKQLGKTNGSVADLLNDGAATNEELGDTIVPEKTFNKEENLNAEKNNSKEENTFSKKIAEIKDNSTHDFPKDSEENSASDPLEKSSAPPNENNLSIKESSPLPTENREDEKEESCAKGEVQTVRTESEANDSSDEGYVDAEEKPASSVTRAVEENNSIPDKLDLSSEPKANVQEGELKSESKISAITSEEKISDKEFHSREGGTDIGDSNDLSSNEVVQNVQTSDEIPATPTKATRKKASKKPQKERQPLKRKTVLENPPKPKGRKKNKINFDDAEAGTSRQPGRTSSRTNRQTRQGLSLEDFIVSDDDEWQSDRSEPKTRRKRGRRRGEDSGSDWEVDHKKTKKPLHKVWSGSESGSEQNSQKKKGPKGRRKKVQSDEAATNDVASDEEPQPSSSGEVKLDKLRIPCTYGKKCFRRSTNHKDQFSHPGDSDYTSETETNQKNNDAISESEEESPKRECPYGVNCFRKNPQHKRDFKHTKKVRPQREAAKQADKKAKNSTRNSDEVDSYDLNDSFLNDDSADEYKPMDSGSDYESGEITKKLGKVKGSKRGRGKKL